MGAQAAVEKWSNIIDEISSNEGETTENIISANSSWLYGYISALKAAKMINDEQYQQMMNIMGEFVKKEYEKLENQNENIVHTFEEIQQYRNIGTVEECKIAMEKQQPKKIKAMRCDCGNILLPFDTFCNECGQKVKVAETDTQIARDEKCKECTYYGRPSDAPESVPLDCIYQPETGEEYKLPCEESEA